MSNPDPINRRLIIAFLAVVTLCVIFPALLWVFVISPQLPTVP